MSESRPPLRARLHWYDLSSEELALLQAMVEHCSDGSTIWAAIPRLAAYSKLSERTVQRRLRQFCTRGILTELAPPNTGRRRPATYRLNEEALHFDPKMRPYINRQQQLPGINRSPVPGEPIPDRPLVSQSHQTGVTVSPVLVSGCHQSGVTVSPDPKAFDPKAFDPEPLIHRRAELNSIPRVICERCGGSGIRASISIPGKGVICECRQRTVTA
jgi:hypothetical protein